MKTPFRALLLALVTAVAALAALTLSAGAQTPGGEAGSGESSSTETAQGRIIARVQDQTGEDGVDNYRIEFGFFPEWALDEADPWSAAITTRSDWLPSSRFLTKSRIDTRAAADNRSWLRSSLITVPAQSAQSPGGAGAQITGRVIARYNPDSDGRLRDQFGFGDLRLEFLFVPEWAFTNTASTAEAVERLGAEGLPRARYLSVATIDARRDVWLRSSTVNVPLRAPVVVIEQPQAPVIDSVSCTPSSPTVDESVTCAATLSGGAPASYAWSGGASNGGAATYITSFSTAGSKTISLTVANTAGSDTAAATVIVGSASANNPPNCPGAARQHLTDDMSVSFTERYASLCTDPDGDTLTWSLSSSDTSVVQVSQSGGDWTIQAVADGLARIDVTAADPGGSSTRTSIEVLVVDPPSIAAVNCAPTQPVVGERVTCTATLGDGIAPDTTRWAGGTAANGSGLTFATSFDATGDHLIYFDVFYLWIGSQRETAITVVEGSLQPPVIDAVNCSPSSPTATETVVCSATLSGGAPESWAWRTANDSGSGVNHSTSFSKAGDYAVSLTVTNAAGSDSDSITLTVGALQAPVIDSINCSPSSPTATETVVCSATLSGGAPESWAWRTANDSGSGVNHSTSFSKAGDYAVSLTVTNAAGSDTDSITLTVAAAVQAPVIDSISCSPSSPKVAESVTCTATLSGGAPTSLVWSGGVPGPWRDGDVTLGAVLSGGTATYNTSFRSAGSQTVSLTATNAAGSDTDSISLTVSDTVRAPVITSIACSTASPIVDQPVTCAVTLSSGLLHSWYSYAWSGGDEAGSNEAYNTSFSSTGPKTVSVTVSNAAGSATDSVALTVLAAAQAPVVDSITCTPSSPTADQTVTCTVTLSGGDYTSRSWNSTPSYYAGNNDGGSFTFLFSNAGVYTISMTASNAVGSDTGSTTITVAASQPAENLQAPVIDAINCTRHSLGWGFDCTPNLSGGAPTTYDWNGQGPTPDQPTLGVWFPAVPGDRTISLTVANAAGSDTHSVTVTVVVQPAIDSISCSPSSPTVDESVTCTATLSGGSPASYAWSGGADTGSSATYNTSFSSAGSKTVSLTVTNSVGSDTDSISLTVFDAVQAPVIDSISCSPSSPTVDQSVTCTATLSGGSPASYAWSGGADAGSSAAYNTSFSSTGSKTVSLTVTNSAGSDTDSLTVTVVVQPAIDSISCSPSSPTVDESVTCTATLSGGAPASYAWSGGADAGSSAAYSTNFSSAGAKTVSLTVTNSAGSDTDSVTLTVAAATVSAPVIDSISCSPSSPTVDQSVTCTATLSGGAPASYAWSGGPSSGSSADYNTSFSSSGSKTISLTVTNSAGSDTDSLTVTVAAATAVQAPVIDSISCSSVSAQRITCTATLSGGAPASYLWSIGGSPTITTAVLRVSFGDADPKTISLTVTNSGGSDTESITVTLTAAATAVQAPVVDSISCTPASPKVAEFVTCTATLSGSAPASYSWSGGAWSGSSATYNTSFSSSGSKTVSLTVTNAAGSDTDSVTVTVAAAAVQAPVIDSVSCSPAWPTANEPVTCTATLSGGAPASYSWSGGASHSNLASNLATYVTSFSSAGSKTVSLTATNAAGSDSESITVTVVAVTAQSPPQWGHFSCSPTSPTVNQSVTCTAGLRVGAPASWVWSGGASSGATSSGSSSTYTTSFDSVGSQRISFVATNPLGSTSYGRTVTVVAAVPVVQAPAIDSISCSPSKPTVGDTITCTATLSGGAPNSYPNPYFWSGGALNSSLATYNTSFSSTGAKTISLTVTNSAGSDTDSVTLTVAAATGSAPVVDSVSCSPASPTVDQSVTCTATLSGGAPTTYAWSGGASNGSSAAYNTSFSSAGSKTVSLTVTNSAGSDTDSVTVTVVAAPIQAPVVDSISCSPASPKVSDAVTCAATLSGGAPASYSWSGGASSGNSATYNTSFSSSGSKTVSLTVTNSAGSDTDSVTVTVAAATVQAPVVDSISCSPASPTASQSVTCTATLSGGAPASYSWSGGAWSGSSATYNTIFNSAGSRTVSLTVTNTAGSASGSTTVTVAADPSVQAPVIDSISCSPSSPTVGDTVTCTATLSGGAPKSYPNPYFWSGGSFNSSLATYNISFSSPGSKTISLTVTNSAGSDTDSVTLTVAAAE